MPVHARIDITRWLREIPLSGLRSRARTRVEQWAREDPSRYPDRAALEEHVRFMGPRAEMVYGPREISVIEQLRAESGADRGRAVSTDVCVWGLGAPANPAATKIGGRPYRPTAAPWPTSASGEPMGLLAQFCFVDSHDVVPDRLPGDVLLVFTAGLGFYSDWSPEDEATYRFEWHRIDPACGAPATAPRVFDLTETYAELHRTADYPESQVDDGLNVIEGSKFGGVPAFQQGDPELSGRHLCTLGSLNPFGDPWPLLNVPKNPGGERYLDPNLLMLGDLGAAYIFLDDWGRTTWAADCG